MNNILYHGTSKTFGNEILKEGLLPRKNKGNWTTTGKIPSIEGMVYLTSDFALADFYGLRAALYTHDDITTTISLDMNDLNPSDLYPDENFYVSGSIDAKGMQQAQCKAIEEQFRWKECLDKMKLICHKGPISTVIEVTEKPLEQNSYSFMVSDTRTIQEFDLKLDIIICTIERTGKPLQKPKFKIYKDDILLLQDNGNEYPCYVDPHRKYW
jgi:hypothetical protein